MSWHAFFARTPPILLSAIVFGLGLGFAAPSDARAGCLGSSEPSANLGKDRARQAVSCLINRERSAQNVRRNGKLEDVAQAHTSTMRRQNCFSHRCAGEPDLTTRVKRTSYSSTPFVGEVLISYPSGATPRDVVDAWMRSSLHRDVILTRSFKDIGVGVSVKGGNALFTVVLGHK